MRETTVSSIEAWRRWTQTDRQLTHRYLINFIKIHELLPEKLTETKKKEKETPNLANDKEEDEEFLHPYRSAPEVNGLYSGLIPVLPPSFVEIQSVHFV